MTHCRMIDPRSEGNHPSQVFDYVMSSVKGDDELRETSTPSAKMMLCVKECICKLLKDVHTRNLP
jgi:hypothetical protein